MANKFFVSPAPHVHGELSTTRLMGDVVIALLPALMVSVRVFGWNVLAITAVSIACCVLFEFLVQKYLVKGAATVGNLSAVVTGLLLAMNLPANIPLWIVVIGALVAICIAKMPFGGLGKNIFNPALAARVFLLIAYPVQMTSFPKPTLEGFADAYSGATPLGAAKAGLVDFASFDIAGMFTGAMGGSFGEISALALLLGFVYLLMRRVISWHIPVAVIGTIIAFSAIYGATEGGELVWQMPLFHILSGGALLGAIFMATDYVTSPMTTKGMVIYGIGIGVITMCIRLWGAYP
ncbi:MAG: RnfABCDGE type electron transport complex subunit D, partial [Alistipes sp.]|nr:RnfABCDGE type electron transport complex subunit D [Alistipes sp.]